MSPREKLSVIVASSFLSAFLLALALAPSPQVHARFHPDIGSPDHECAVTLIATGKCDQANVPPVIVAPQLAVVFEEIPSFASAPVTASFLDAHIFEHAPPALSQRFYPLPVSPIPG